MTTIPELVRTAAARFGDGEALVDPSADGTDSRWTFTELAERVDVSARAFVTAGVVPGDRVAVWAPNIHEWVVAALGVHTAGGVLVPINTRFKGVEAADIIGRSRARILVTVNGFLGFDYPGMLQATGAELPHLQRIVVLRGPLPGGTVPHESIAWADFLAAADPHAPLPAVGDDDLSDILFTAGTTGRPKGVMSAHGQTVRLIEAWCANVGLARGDRYLVINPFFHSFGYKAGIVACLVAGATIVPLSTFDVDRALELVARERISTLPGAPTLYHSILNHPARGEYDLSSLRLAVTGAAPVPVELVRRMREELTFGTIITAYGMTEAVVITACRPDDDPETISGTSGRAIDGVEVRLADTGEILVRGYNVMRGYFEDPEATAAAIDADGWLHTGDVGTMDERGYVDITDRIKDMYISGGFNVYPAEVENALLGHPAIGQVAIVGVPDDRMGEVGNAFVVPRAGAAVDPTEIIAWSRERLANYKVPTAVHVVSTLPTNPAGKVLKFELRSQLSLPSAPASTG
jgi:acyl-CoA synthetase (AMP-forming)/AMP-acid ligase II